MLKCKLKVLFIARSSDMQNLGKNLNLTAFQTRSPSDERDAEVRSDLGFEVCDPYYYFFLQVLALRLPQRHAHRLQQVQDPGGL